MGPPYDRRRRWALPTRADGLSPMSRSLRVFLLLCALTLSVALSLVRPVGGRAQVAPKPRPTRRLAAANFAFGLRVVSYAKHFLGVPYVYGGSTPRGFDCSGFVRYVYAHFGVTLPHSSYAQFSDGRRVGRGSLHPGDLVFFDAVGHVGIYIGNGRFIHAPHSGTRVRIERFAGWYGARFSGARRLRNA
jgi:cell wall-associated NlpC family hydrolase